MYGLVALGYHITWVTSRTMNFSQGHAVMAGAVVAYAGFVALGWPFPLALLIALVALAIEQAGATDGSKVRDALESLKSEYKGLIKSYRRPFSPEQHDALTDEDYVMVVWKGGKIVPVTMK